MWYRNSSILASKSTDYSSASMKRVAQEQYFRALQISPADAKDIIVIIDRANKLVNQILTENKLTSLDDLREKIGQAQAAKDQDKFKILQGLATRIYQIVSQSENRLVQRFKMPVDRLIQIVGTTSPANQMPLEQLQIIQTRLRTIQAASSKLAGMSDDALMATRAMAASNLKNAFQAQARAGLSKILQEAGVNSEEFFNASRAEKSRIFESMPRDNKIKYNQLLQKSREGYNAFLSSGATNFADEAASTGAKAASATAAVDEAGGNVLKNALSRFGNKFPWAAKVAPWLGIVAMAPTIVGWVRKFSTEGPEAIFQDPYQQTLFIGDLANAVASLAAVIPGGQAIAIAMSGTGFAMQGAAEGIAQQQRAETIDMNLGTELFPDVKQAITEAEPMIAAGNTILQINNALQQKYVFLRGAKDYGNPKWVQFNQHLVNKVKQRRNAPQGANAQQGAYAQGGAAAPNYQSGTMTQNAQGAQAQRILSRGTQGPDVKQWQQALISQGLLPVGSDDGIFGDSTFNATVMFQRQKNLPADGIVGPQTRAAMTGQAAPSQPQNPAMRPTASARYYWQKA